MTTGTSNPRLPQGSTAAEVSGAHATPISIIVGSLRRGSFARKIAHELRTFFPDDYDASIIEIADLPMYNYDYDDPEVIDVELPPEYIRFRTQITQSKGILFVTPENNRTIPACLKNAIDIGSKPNNAVAWQGLPVGIVSHSVGRLGGYSSHKNLKLALSYFNMQAVPQPEVFLGNSPELFAGGDSIANEATRTFLQDYVQRFVALVAQNDR